MLFFRPFYAVPVESVADAGVQNLADVPQVRDLLRGGQTFLGGLVACVRGLRAAVDTGYVQTKGKLAPLLELGAGFSQEYTGRENIYLYGAVLGYSKEFLDEKFDEIVDFSELGEFIDVPIKNYSSGMKSRLGFSIATVVEPEILILDEVLSVGDKKFRRKSEKKIMDMFDKGVTVLFVSHSLEQVQRICDRAIILDGGHLVAKGPVDKVARIYKNMTE